MTRQTSRRRFLKATAATGAVAGLNVAVLAQDDGQGEEVILLGGNTPGWIGYRLPGGEDGDDGDDGDDGENPTLNLQEETTYTLIWQNVDGVGHNFAIQDSDGENMQVLQPLSVEQDAYEELNETEANESVSLEISDGNVTGVSMGNESDDVDDGNQTDEETPSEDELVERTEIISEEGAVQGARFTATSEMDQYICLVHPNTMVGDVNVEGGDGDGMGNNSSG